MVEQDMVRLILFETAERLLRQSFFVAKKSQIGPRAYLHLFIISTIQRPNFAVPVLELRS